MPGLLSVSVRNDSHRFHGVVCSVGQGENGIDGSYVYRRIEMLLVGPCAGDGARVHVTHTSRGRGHLCDESDISQGKRKELAEIQNILRFCHSPSIRQVCNVLRLQGYTSTVFKPANIFLRGHRSRALDRWGSDYTKRCV